MTQGFELRPAEPRDHDGIASGYASATHREVAAVRDEVRHVFEHAPFGVSSLVAVTPSGEVAAHFGALHVPMRLKDEPRTFGRQWMSFVHPDFQIGGVHALFAALDETFAETFESDGPIDVLFGWWNEDDWWHLRHLRGFEAVMTSMRLSWRRGGFDGKGLHAEILRGSPEVYADWKEALEGGPCTQRRDGAWVGFRHGGPFAEKDKVYCAHRDGRVRGVAVTRDVNDRTEILDWALEGSDEGLGRALLAAIVDDGPESLHMNAWTTSHESLQFLQALGFRVAGGDEAYLAVRISTPGINQQWLAEHWEVGSSDMGLHPNPAMTAGEQVVTPPPSGTTAGRTRHGH